MSKSCLLSLMTYALTSLSAQAHDQWSVGVNIGNPYPPAVRYYAPPVIYYAPPSAYYPPPPVTYSYPNTVVYGSPNVVYRNYTPNVIQFSYGRGFGGGYERHERWEHEGHGRGRR